MQQFMQFVIHHWLLCGLFVVLLIFLFIEEARYKGFAGGLSPQQVVQKINHEKVVVLDLRDTRAFEEGHIVGAVNQIAAQVEKDLSKLDKYKEQSLILVDATGQKAAALMTKLRKSGFKEVQLMTGGLSAWKKAELPLKKKGK